MRMLIGRFAKDQSGVTAVEYGLILMRVAATGVAEFGLGSNR